MEPDDRLHNNNWKQVANHLKLPYREICWLEDQKGTRYGPMEHLLFMWETEKKSLSEFVDLMKEIRRFDVVTRIEHYEKLFRNEQRRPSETTFTRRVRNTFRALRVPRRHQTTGQSPIAQNDLNNPKNPRRDRFDTDTTPSRTQWHHPYLRQFSSSAQ